MELLRFLHQSLFKLVHVWANVSNTPTGLFLGLPYLYTLIKKKSLMMITPIAHISHYRHYQTRERKIWPIVAYFGAKLQKLQTC